MQMVSSAYFDEKYDYKERDIIRNWKTVVLDENIA